MEHSKIGFYLSKYIEIGLFTAGITVVCLLLLASCKKECKMRPGSFKTEIIEPGVFHEIILEGQMQVTLVQDSSYRVSVSANETILEGIKTEVNSDKLTILNQNGCRVFRGYASDNVEVKIGVGQLSKIRMTLPGALKCADTLKGSDLVAEIFDCSGNLSLCLNYNKAEIVNIKGAADITISGKAHQLYLRNEDKGFIYGQSLLGQHVEVVQEGLGDIYVLADQTLQIEMRSGGNVIYSGNAVPKIEIGPVNRGTASRKN
jgi:hypothetical protein